MSLFDDIIARITGIDTGITDSKQATINANASFLTSVDPTATPTNIPATDAATAGTTIRSALLAGYNIAIFTSSNAAWPVPSIFSEATGICINGGDKGGTATTSAGGIGGINGGYLVSLLTLTGITPGSSTLNITVGAAAASAGTPPNAGAGGVSSIKFGATTLLQGVANASGMATKEGYSISTSTPGSGGTGGFSTSTGVNGTAGGSSAIAAGGAGGTGYGNTTPTTGINGSNGAAGASTAVPLCGGGGGGGGGNHWRGSALLSAVGGNGGNGGFPGGASGGGGNATSGAGQTQGVGGTAANGLVAIIYK